MDEVRLDARLLNNRLRQMREERGLTIKQLSKLIGCGDQTIGQLERLYTRSPRVEKLLADFFEVERSWLIPEWLYEACKEPHVVKTMNANQLIEVSRGLRLLPATTVSDEPSPYREAVSSDLKKMVHEILLGLNDERARQVLILRFGLEGNETHTLKEVGEKLGVLRETVRIIEAKALRRLRHPVRKKRLQDFFWDDAEENER